LNGFFFSLLFFHNAVPQLLFPRQMIFFLPLTVLTFFSLNAAHGPAFSSLPPDWVVVALFVPPNQVILALIFSFLFDPLFALCSNTFRFYFKETSLVSLLFSPTSSLSFF